MSLDKAILSGKEHRKPYTYAKGIDPSCRNHGSCPFCQSNRLYRTLREKERTETALREETMREPKTKRPHRIR